MTYHAEALATLILRRIYERPGVRLVDLARDLGVSRRTVHRVLISRLGVSFREIQGAVLAARIAELRRENPGWSTKELAYALDFRHPKSMTRRLKAIAGREHVRGGAIPAAFLSESNETKQP